MPVAQGVRVVEIYCWFQTLILATMYFQSVIVRSWSAVMDCTLGVPFIFWHERPLVWSSDTIAHLSKVFTSLWIVIIGASSQRQNPPAPPDVFHQVTHKHITPKHQAGFCVVFVFHRVCVCCPSFMCPKLSGFPTASPHLPCKNILLVLYVLSMLVWQKETGARADSSCEASIKISSEML